MVTRFLDLWSRSLALREQSLAVQQMALIEVRAAVEAHRQATADIIGCARIMAEANAETAKALSTYFQTYRDAMTQTPLPQAAFSEEDLKRLLVGVDDAHLSLDPLLDAMP